MSSIPIPIVSVVPGPDVPARTSILGVGISVVDVHEAIRQCEELVRARGHGYLCAVDAHSLVEAVRNPAHRRILNHAFLTVADGMPLVWMGRLRGNAAMRRVYGPDFLLAVCAYSVERGWRHFFYGGRPGVAGRLAARLTERFPGLQIAGTFAPPFRDLTPAEETELKARVEEARTDVLWVGLGAPRQERFMAEHNGKLACALMAGVGAAFDFHSGMVKEAPRWLHNTGLQWVYRVMREPRRLGRRYLTCIPVFAWNVGLEVAGIRRLRPET